MRSSIATALVITAGCAMSGSGGSGPQTAPQPTGPPGVVVGAGPPPPAPRASGSDLAPAPPPHVGRARPVELDPPPVDVLADAPPPAELAPLPAPPTPATAPPADPQDRLESLEASIVDEVNRLRSDPQGYAVSLAQFRSYYDGRVIQLPDRRTPILTYEGVAAVDEAIEIARKTAPVAELTVSRGLQLAARAHAAELGAAGTIAHEGADGSLPHKRMERFGALRGLSGENIGTGHDRALYAVIDLFVDDGVATRGHRDNLIEPKYRQIGVGCADHVQWQVVCVMDFAADFRER